jgi:hypothetical protein
MPKGMPRLYLLLVFWLALLIALFHWFSQAFA